MVEQQPAIWDKGCEQYKDRMAKDKAWVTVANGTTLRENRTGGQFASHSMSSSNFRGLPLLRAAPANHYSTRHSMSLA